MSMNSPIGQSTPTQSSFAPDYIRPQQGQISPSRLTDKYGLSSDQLGKREPSSAPLYDRSIQTGHDQASEATRKVKTEKRLYCARRLTALMRSLGCGSLLPKVKS